MVLVTGLVIALVLGIAACIGYLVWVSTTPDEIGGKTEEPPPTEAELLQARLDLHRVERGVDLALAKQDQRREAERVKEAIAEALGGGRQ